MTILYFIIFIFIAYLSNSYIDAIDHGKAARTLRVVWHMVKWGICLPAYFLAGVSFVCIGLSLAFYDIIYSIFMNNWYWILPLWVCLHFIWEGHYKFWRIYFKKHGIPDYF